VFRPGVIPLALAFAAGTAIIAPTVPASAASAFVGIKCTSLRPFSIHIPIGFSPAAIPDGAGVALSGCDGNTGGFGVFPFSTTQSQTITWANGKTTELGGANVSTTDYDPDTRGTCPPSLPEYKATGVVMADTTGSAPVLGKYSYEVCTDGSFVENEPGRKVKIA
jgi:hypothetical protein